MTNTKLKPKRNSSLGRLKYFSAFSGIGGIELGIEQAYEEICNKIRTRKTAHARPNMPDIGGGDKRGWGDKQSPVCVGYSEIDRYACQIYEKHFPKHRNFGDISKLNLQKLPDHDLLVGGFPCQSFSIAGKRGGFKDTRGTLFFSLAEIAKVKRPRYLLFENVKGLLSHDEGNTFATIISTLDELGYDLQWQVLNSKNFGVPQNRERVFVVGHLRGTSRPKVFPIGENNQENDSVQSEKDRQGTRIPCLNTRYGQRWSGEGYIANQPSSQKGGDKSNSSNGIRRATYTNDTRIRRLTPTECERLQGFPGGWTEGVSDTQRYKTLGNAITTNVVKCIIERLLYG